MVTRRRAVFGMGVAALASASSPSFALLEGLVPVLPQAAERAADTEAVDDRLAREIARLAFREDSEAGVPVLLACVNLVVDRTTGRVPAPALTPANVQLASEMRRDAAAWERLRPNCPASDVAHLVQALAVRDFAAGGALEQSA